jgi:hypothetical protein
MSRHIRADGTPYPRRRPLDWERTRDILRHRQAHRDILKAGFAEVHEFAGFPNWMNKGCGKKMIDSCIHPDGTRLYVKIVEDN